MTGRSRASSTWEGSTYYTTGTDVSRSTSFSAADGSGIGRHGGHGGGYYSSASGTIITAPTYGASSAGAPSTPASVASLASGRLSRMSRGSHSSFHSAVNPAANGGGGGGHNASTSSSSGLITPTTLVTKRSGGGGGGGMLMGGGLPGTSVACASGASTVIYGHGGMTDGGAANSFASAGFCNAIDSDVESAHEVAGLVVGRKPPMHMRLAVGPSGGGGGGVGSGSLQSSGAASSARGSSFTLSNGTVGTLQVASDVDGDPGLDALAASVGQVSLQQQAQPVGQEQ